MREAELRESIDRGNAARRAGDLQEALAHYRTALDLAPDHAEASSLYGLMLLHLGDSVAAEPALRKAVTLDPQHIGFRMNLAALFEKEGRTEEAIGTLQAVCNLMPAFPRAWERLGDLMFQTQRPADALGYYDRAATLEPHDRTIALKRASAIFRLGRLDEARRTVDGLLRTAPQAIEVFQLYANVLTAQADWSALERLSAGWVKSHPTSAAGWQALTTAVYESGRLREAMELYRNVLQHAGRDPTRLTVYAQYCLNVSEFDEAGTALAEAEKLDPSNVELLSAKGLLLTYLGRFAEAEACCRQALTLDPQHIPAYRVLNRLTSGRLSVDEQSTLADLSRRPGLRAADRIAASFSLADSLDASGDFDGAFAVYQDANQIGYERAASEKITYNAAQRATWIDSLVQMFSLPPPPRLRQEQGPRPIFIVGMPRSGTTLAESILAAHSRVFACGERTVMPQILFDFLLEATKVGLDRIADERWLNWVRAYWYELPYIGGADNVTDKNPFNFESVGLIAQLFPDAKIIHMRRNAVETGLSIYRNQFPKFVTFANRLEDIGHYYGQYARLVTHWERVLGDRFVTVQYESLATDFDRVAPALVAACGLDWEEACRTFDKSDRPVATLSAVQVRGGLKLEGRTRHYERHLGPLVQALDAAQIDLATGAMRPSPEQS